MHSSGRLRRVANKSTSTEAVDLCTRVRGNAHRLNSLALEPIDLHDRMDRVASIVGVACLQVLFSRLQLSQWQIPFEIGSQKTPYQRH